MSKQSKRPKSHVCEGCGQTGAHYVVLDDRGLQAGVFLFCSNCTPKLKYRTGDYVVRWYRISSDLPPSRKPHRDVDLWTRPRWGEHDYVSPHDQAAAATRKRQRRGRSDLQDGSHNIDDDDNNNNYNNKPSTKVSETETKIDSNKQPSKPNFFAALSAAKEAGPMPAHIKPLKRMCLEVAAKTTLENINQTLATFERLRLGLHACLQTGFIDQMVELNRLSDYHARCAREALAAQQEEAVCQADP